MAKNKNFFSKLLTFTAAAAAVGGACYVFRDKIRNSPLYKATLDKAYDLYDKWKERQDDDLDDDFEDFSFDEDDDFDDVFSTEDKSEREYTSITINAKEEPIEETNDETEDRPKEDEAPQPDTASHIEDTPIEDETSQKEDAPQENETSQKEDTPQENETSQDNETLQESEVPTVTTPSEESDDTSADGIIPTIPFGTKDSEEEQEVLGYENEGLSDVSEDPDVLEEQDKLDF